MTSGINPMPIQGPMSLLKAESCVYESIYYGSDNGMSPIWHQVINWTNDGISSRLQCVKKVYKVQMLWELRWEELGPVFHA